MEKFSVKLRKKKICSEEFRKSRVKEYESGEYTVRELSGLYGIHFQTIYNWIYKYSTYNKKGLVIVESKESSTQKVKALQERIQEQERIVGQKQLNIDYFKKMIELAKEEYDIDVKETQASTEYNYSPFIIHHLHRRQRLEEEDPTAVQLNTFVTFS